MFENADGARVNTILGKRVFKHEIVSNDEVKEAIGISIKELITLWIFDSKNDFQQMLNEYRVGGKKLSFKI